MVNNERNANCELGYDRTLSIATMTFNGGNGAADDSLSNYKVIRIGDIAFEGHTNKVHAYGRFVLNDAGDGLMSPRFSCLRPIVEQRYSFWKYYIPREESMRPILVNATKSGTMMNELVPDDLMRESILVPCLAEQEVIGNSLSQLDHLITLHQRKRKYRGLYGYLSWEQRKLGELFVESDERSSTEEILSVSVANGIYPASESERDTNPGASIANYKIVRVGDIVYNSMRMWQGAVGSSRYNGIVSPAYVVAKPVVELDSTCFGYLLKRPELLYKYLCNSQGNSKDTQTLRYERFAEITAEVPSTIEEQRAISDCLEGLDSLITLHQREPRFADTG